MLVSKLIKKDISNVSDLKKYKDFYNFFRVIENIEVHKKIEKIEIEVERQLIKEIEEIKNISKEYNLNKENIIFLYSFFLIKSFSSQNWDTESDDYMFVEFYSLIWKFISYEEKFLIFYFNKKKDNFEIKKTFRSVCSLYTVLGYNKILEFKKEDFNLGKNSIKTKIFISLGIFLLEDHIREKILINFNPFLKKDINGSSYQVGSFFTKVVETFKPNPSSNKKFFLKNDNLLYKLNETSVEINREDFYEIKNEYKKYLKIEKNSIKEEIIFILDNIKLKKKKIKEKNEKKKNNYKLFILDIIEKDFLLFKRELSLENVLIFAYTKCFCYSLKENNIEITINVENNISSFIIKNLKEIILKKAINEKDFNNVVNFFKKKILGESELKDNSQLLFFEKEWDWLYVTNNYDEDYKDYISEEQKTKIKSFLYENFNIIFYPYKLSKRIKEENKMYMLDSNEEDSIGIEVKEDQRDFSKYFNYFIFEIIEECELFEKKLFFPYSFDFRGRLYFDSLISITHFKPSRYFLNYGRYTKEEILNISNKKYIFWKKFNIEIDEIEKRFKINKKEYYIKDAIFWILISIGKEFIKKNKESHSLSEIIEEGKNAILNEKNELSLEKKIILKHYIKIIKSFNDELPLKRFIQKDATASFIQNMIRLIGPKNENSLIKANLLSQEKWYDTYLIALNEWRKNISNQFNKDIIEEYFTRNNIKKPIMVSSYDATFMTRWEYFIEEIKKSLNKNEKNNLELLEIFKDFINFIDNTFWEDIFLSENSKILISEIQNKVNINKSAIIESHDATSDLIYFKFKNMSQELTIKINENIKIRRVKTFNIIDKDNIYNKKIKISTRANWAHFSDATLMRQINERFKKPYLSIHDCFLIDPFSIGNFIDKANKAFKDNNKSSLKFNKKLNDKIYSIFIFI